MNEKEAKVASSASPRGLDKVLLYDSNSPASRQTGENRPSPEGDGQDYIREGGAKGGGHGHGQNELREGHKDVRYPHEDIIPKSSKIGGDYPDNRSQCSGNDED
jgi:hypothetical protein